MKSRWVIIILIVVLVAAAIIYGVWWWTDNEEQIDPAVSPTAVVSAGMALYSLR
jgi:flagellar basal body-associated protein FliL